MASASDGQAGSSVGGSPEIACFYAGFVYPAKGVYLKRVSWVRIPSSPPQSLEMPSDVAGGADKQSALCLCVSLREPAERTVNRGKRLGDMWELDETPLRRANYHSTTREPPEWGFLYVLACERFVKVGLAEDVYKRIRTLQNATPFPLRRLTHQRIPYILRRAAEARAHTALAKHRIHGEWFDIEDHDAVVRFIVRLCEMAQQQYFQGTFQMPPGFENALESEKRDR